MLCGHCPLSGVYVCILRGWFYLHLQVNVRRKRRYYSLGPIKQSLSLILATNQAGFEKYMQRIHGVSVGCTLH
jgi:hypothetical protein